MMTHILNTPSELLLCIADHLDRHSIEHLAVCCNKLHRILHGYVQQRYRTELAAHRRIFRACVAEVGNIYYDINNEHTDYSWRQMESKLAIHGVCSIAKKNNSDGLPHIRIHGKVWGMRERYADAITNDVWLCTYFHSWYYKFVQEITTLVQCEYAE
jgi:hypothetical protein